MQFDFAEAEPMIGVELARALEAMAQKVEDGDPARLSSGCGGRRRWRARDGWRDSAPDLGWRDRPGPSQWEDLRCRRAGIPNREAVFGREVGAEFDHLRRVIDRDDFARGLREELRERALAGAEVGDGERGRSEIKVCASACHQRPGT